MAVTVFNPHISAIVVAGTTATGPQISLGTSPTVTFGIAGNTITASAGGGGGNTGFLSANGNTASLGTVEFANGNGVTFGLNGQTLTASHNGFTVQSVWTVSDNATSATVRELAFTNLNGVTLSLSTGPAGLNTIVGSHNGLTSQSNQAVSGSNGSFTFQTAFFSNANGISFGTSAGPAITASHNGLTSQSNQALSAPNGSFAFQTAQFHNSHGIAWSTTTGSGIIASHNGITSQSNQQMTLLATGNTTQSSTGTTNASSIIFRGAGDVSVGITGGSVVVSGTQTNQQMTLFATGNTTQSSTGTTNASSVIFRGEGLASVGITNGSIVVSVPAGAPSPVNFSAGTTSNNLGSVVFSDANGVSFGLNGSTITASVAGGGPTASQWAPYVVGQQGGGGAQGQGTMHIAPVSAAFNATFDRVGIYVSRSNATNSTGTITLSLWFGLYTRNASTLSRYASASSTHGITFHGTVSSYSQHGGPRLATVGFSSSVSAGEYWAAVISSTTSAGAGGTFNQMLLSQFTANFSGVMGVGSNATKQEVLGKGVYTAATGGIPASVAFSQINGTASLAMRAPIWVAMNGTV